MIVLGNNKITSDMITVTGGSNSLSGDRCVNQVADEVTLATIITIDFGEAVDVDAIGAVNSSANLLVEASSSSTFATIDYAVYLTSVNGSNVMYQTEETTQTYR